MQDRWIKKSLCLLCLSVAAVAMAQSETPSILDRVQKVDDPELAELIRVAIENRKNLDQKETLEIIRKVTLSYVQVKLLDQQIVEVSRKIEAKTGPAEMRYELLLAKSELESKLMTELANLREIMGIVPRFPFEKQPIPNLNAWVNLQVLDQRVVVYDGVKPFSDYWAMARYKVAGVLSEKEALDYIRGRLKDKKNLPMRIDINYRAETRSAGERLRDAVIPLAQETNTDMDVEVRLELIWWVGSEEAPFFLREGKIRTLYAEAVPRPDGGPKFLTTGLVDPNDLEQHILWRLSYPGNVPLKLRLEYDKASALMAKQVAQTVKTVAQGLGLAELVEVAEVLVEPVPQTMFLGRWEALGKGYLQAIDVQPQGICQVIMGDGSEAIQAGARVKGTWMPTTKEIFVDINDKVWGKGEYYYVGFINQKGNLVVDRADIYLQGSLRLATVGQMTFQKVK